MSGPAEFAGALNQRITLETQSAGTDADGGPSGTWQSLGLVWAHITPAGAGPETVGGTLAAMARYHITLRCRDDLNVGDRLTWRAATYTILTISRDPATLDRMELLVELMR